MENELKEVYVERIKLLIAINDIPRLCSLIDGIWEHGRLEGAISKNKEYCYHKTDEGNKR